MYTQFKKILATGGSLAADFTSELLEVKKKQSSGIQIKATGTMVGEFFIQGTIIDNPTDDDWIAFDFPKPFLATGVDEVFSATLENAPVDNLRVKYVRSSGLGTVDITGSGKRSL